MPLRRTGPVVFNKLLIRRTQIGYIVGKRSHVVVSREVSGAQSGHVNGGSSALQLSYLLLFYFILSTRAAVLERLHFML